MSEKFKLTYATMFNPPESLHTEFDAAIAKTKANMGQEYGMIINNKDVFADEKFEDCSPINTDWVLAKMQKGNAQHAEQAQDAVLFTAEGSTVKSFRLNLGYAHQGIPSGVSGRREPQYT